ncbi:MAG: DUF4118 domain-containing protein [Firmicutes bacterium]|nr:DUF4118 domain-containing protein [Bacillota bacterium]
MRNSDSSSEYKTGIADKLYDSFYGYIFSALLVFFVSGVLIWSGNRFEKSHTGLFFLMAIVFAANISGTRAAILAAVLSFLCWNFFFLPPFYTFEIHDTRDWLLLFTFLAIGITVGQIAGQVKAREREARAREQEALTLYNASLIIGNRVNLNEALDAMAELLYKSIHPAGCLILVRGQAEGKNEQKSLLVNRGLNNYSLIGEIEAYIEKNHACVREDITGYYSVETRSEESAASDTPAGEDDELLFGGILKPVATKRGVIGAVFVLPEEERKISGSETRLITAFAGLAGITIERYRFLEETLRSEAIHESERLKTVMFSSISHNLKNPLVSLTAAMSSLRQQDVALSPELVNEHLLIMEEDIKRINENTENLLNLARLETGMWKPRKDWNELGEIIGSALSPLPEAEYKRVKVEFPEPLIMVNVDSIQMTQVVRHLTENALEYSPAGSVVTISAARREGLVFIHVDDQGKGIPEKERENIFGKFFSMTPQKGRTTKRTGLGLIICREIVKAHSGSLLVGDSPAGGARFTIKLPNSEADGAKNES